MQVVDDDVVECCLFWTSRGRVLVDADEDRGADDG